MTSTRMNQSEPKQKIRQRASTPRSKTGCITCKMRRLKCGEEKPGCNRCSKSGWKCDGYEHLSNNGSASLSTRTPSPGSYLYTPSSLDLNEQERRYFQHYIDQSPATLDPRDTDQASAFKQAILQESHSNPCVRHIIVALGALEQSFQLKCKWGYIRNMNESPDFNHEFALLQYEKALRGLRKSIDSLQKGMGARETLVSALALSVFDFFCGNSAFATQHIRFGRKITAAWRSNHATVVNSQAPISSRVNAPIDDNLTRMFIHHDAQAVFALGIDAECPYTSSLPPCSPEAMIPYGFSNLDEAKRFRQNLLSDGEITYLRSLEYQFVMPEDIPHDWLQIKESYLQRIHLWLAAFDPVLRNYLIDTSVHPLARPEALRFQVVLMLIRMTSILQAPETLFDDLTSHYDYLLSVCRDVFDYERANSAFPFATESYTHEARIIPALYLVALKCRIPNLRNEAISLLFAERRREGIWDSALCGKAAQWMIDLETFGGGWIGDENQWSVRPDGVDPDRRVWGETITRDLQARRATVRCRQNRPLEEGGGWVERSVIVDWV